MVNLGTHLIKTDILFLACCQVIQNLARNHKRLCLIIEIEAKCCFFGKVNIVSAAEISESNIHQNIWRHSPDSKAHGANMGPTWDRQDPGGPHVGPMNFAVREICWSLPTTYISYQHHIYTTGPCRNCNDLCTEVNYRFNRSLNFHGILFCHKNTVIKKNHFIWTLKVNFTIMSYRILQWMKLFELIVAKWNSQVLLHCDPLYHATANSIAATKTEWSFNFRVSSLSILKATDHVTTW